MPLASKAKTGYGASLQVGNAASPEVYTKLAQVLSLKRSGKKQNQEKVTNQDSSADSAGLVYEEIIGTIVTGGTIDVTINFVSTDTTHRNMLALFDGKSHNFKLCGPNDPSSSPVVPYFTFAFSACLFDYPDIDLPLDKAMQLTIKLTIISADTLTYSA